MKSILNIKHIIILSGYMFAVGYSITFMIIFLSAYFSNSKKSIVDINSIGEAHIELFMTLIVMGIIILGLIYFLHDVKKLGKVKNEK